jgi:hypothetical protein
MNRIDQLAELDTRQRRKIIEDIEESVEEASA